MSGGMPLSTDAETGVRWQNFAGRYLSRRSGAEPALRAVIEADPDLAVAHAVAVLLALFDDAGFDPAEEVVAARRGRAEHDWERSYVECVITTHSQGPWPARPSWERHQRRFPGDLLGFEMAGFLTLMSTEPDADDQALRMTHAATAAVGEHPFLLGFEAMLAQDGGRLDEAHRLASRALELDPTGFDGGHPLAHVFFEGADHAEGAAWLDGWLPSTDQQAPFGAHLVWHSALHHLAMGNAEVVLDRYRNCAGRHGFGAVVDGTSLLWRCQLHGLVRPGDDPSSTPVAPVVAASLDRVPFTFVGVHLALGLATAGDADGLRRLAANAEHFAAPGCAELLPGLALGFAAYVEGDHDTASDRLLEQERHFCRYGGSNAQREVFEDTLIQSLVQSSRFDEAVVRLQERLDRRESRLDAALLGRAK